jgi:hypothetical protein
MHHVPPTYSRNASIFSRPPTCILFITSTLQVVTFKFTHLLWTIDIPRVFQTGSGQTMIKPVQTAYFERSQWYSTDDKVAPTAM